MNSVVDKDGSKEVNAVKEASRRWLQKFESSGIGGGSTQRKRQTPSGT